MDAARVYIIHAKSRNISASLKKYDYIYVFARLSKDFLVWWQKLLSS